MFWYHFAIREFKQHMIDVIKIMKIENWFFFSLPDFHSSLKPSEKVVQPESRKKRCLFLYVKFLSSSNIFFSSDGNLAIRLQVFYKIPSLTGKFSKLKIKFFVTSGVIKSSIFDSKMAHVCMKCIKTYWIKNNSRTLSNFP